MKLSLRALSALFCFFFFSNQLYAQDKALVYGEVSDLDTKETLVGVNIIFGDSTTVLSTDSEGKFKASLEPGDYKFTFTYIGYEPKVKIFSLKAGEIKEMNIKLKSDAAEIDLVVVSASQYEKRVAEETVSMDVLSKTLVTNTNSRDLGEVIAKTPGVQIQDGQISIRGGSSYSYGVGSRTAVLTDGISLASADLGDAQLKFVPLENIEQIEVIKGASSVVYGSSALNGVVNVRTAWPKGDKPKTTISMYSGVYGKPPRPELIWWDARQPNFSGFFVNHQQKIKNLQVVIGSNADFVNSFLEEADEFRFRFNFKTRYVLAKKPGISFGLNGNVMQETSGRFFIATDMDSLAYQIAQGSQDRYVRTTLDPHFSFLNDKGHRFTLVGRYLNIWRRGNGDDRNASANTIYFEPQYQRNWRNTLIFTTGTPVTIGRSVSNLYENVRKNRAFAAYAQLEFKYGNLSVVGGVRYEFTSVDTIFETAIPVVRTGVNYKLGKASFVRASWGQAYRLPSIAERYIGQEFFSGVLIVPNPRLTAEKAWSAEIGFNQPFKIKKWGAYIDASVFWMEYADFVEYRFEVYTADNGLDSCGNVRDLVTGNILAAADTCLAVPFVLGLTPNNVDNARILGYEISVGSKGSIGDVSIRSLIGYTYTYPRQVNNAEGSSKDIWKGFFTDMFNRVPTERAEQELLLFRSRHIFRSDVEVSYKKYTAGFSANYNSFPENIPEVFNTALTVLDEGRGTFPAYIDKHQKGDWVMDARVAYEVNDILRLGFIVKNLTNYEYALRPGKLEGPRNYTLQIRVTF
jgi:iron complex outermembrane receptor protein